MTPTRRSLLATPLAGTLSASLSARANGSVPGHDPSAADLLQRYVGFGNKASGGPGDNACGIWMSDWLSARGFAVDRLPFEVPYFEAGEAWLQVGEGRANVIPQAIVVQTEADGIQGPVLIRDPVDAGAPAHGAIVVIRLPFGRWSTAVAPTVRGPVEAALSAGALAVVLVTQGPSGEALALNADGRRPMFSAPVAVLAPKDASAIIRAANAGQTGRLRITGSGGRREAFNLIGRRDQGKGRWLVVSTPRSGWFTCAGERGPGVAVWMMLADWASRAGLPVNLAFACNSGHEYENLGAEQLLDKAAPSPDQTHLWLHLGANVAARDWHEIGGRLAPLPSADPQRFLLASSDLVGPCRAAFKGLPGLEAAYPMSAGAAGELAHIASAGYSRLVGIFGAHRFHHSVNDDQRCVDAELAEKVFKALHRLLNEATAG